MFGFRRFRSRKTANVSALPNQPTHPHDYTHVYVQHERIGTTLMVSRFFLLRDLDSSATQRITDELLDIDEIVRCGGDTLGIHVYSNFLVVHWLLPRDEISREYAKGFLPDIIQEEVLEALSDIFGWRCETKFTVFNDSPAKALRERQQTEQKQGIQWRVA